MGCMEGFEILGQNLSKEVGTIPKPLRKDCPCHLFGMPRVWVCPSESKDILGGRVKGNGKEGILSSKTEKCVDDVESWDSTG